MNRTSCLKTAFVLVACAVAIGVTPVRAAAQDPPAETYRKVLTQYCVTCHNARAKTAATQSGVVLDNADLSHVAANPALWEKVLRRLHAGTMPPQGARRPDDASYH